MATNIFSILFKADMKQHDSAIKKSAAEVYKYKKQVEGAKKELKDFAGDIAIAVISVKTFNEIVSSTERSTDAFGSAMEQAKAAATGFFSTIANGNIGGFIESLKDLTKNAKDAYEALDVLGSDKMWANRRLATIDAQLAEAKLANNTKKINVLLAERKSIIQNLEGKTEDAFMSSLINEIGKSDSTFNHQMADRLQGLSEEDKKQIMYNLLRVGSTSDLEELTKRYYNQNKQYIGYDNLGKMNGNIQTVIYEFYKQLKNIPESQLQLILALQEDAEILKRDNARTTKRYSSESTTSKSTSTKAQSYDEERIRDLDIAYWGNMAESGKYRQGVNWKYTPVIPPEELEDMEEDAVRIIQEAEQKKREELEKTNKELAKQQEIFNLQLDSISSLGSALSTLGSEFNSTGLKAAGIIAEAIANIIKGYATASAQSAELGPWAWAAFSVAGLAQVASVISQIHSLSGYASGGIIQGANTIGDYNLARVNSGEMILNGTQQARLFRMLNNGSSASGSVSGSVEFKIKGQELVGVLNNYAKKTRRVS